MTEHITRMLREDNIPWGPMGPPGTGVEIKILRANAQADSITFLNRFQPGFEAIKHRHLGEVHAYTLEGNWHYLEYDWSAGPGDYVFEPPDTIHTLKVADDATQPTVVFFVVKGGLELYDAGEVFMTVDIAGFEDLYREGLQSIGLDYPEGIVRD